MAFTDKLKGTTPKISRFTDKLKRGETPAIVTEAIDKTYGNMADFRKLDQQKNAEYEATKPKVETFVDKIKGVLAKGPLGLIEQGAQTVDKGFEKVGNTQIGKDLTAGIGDVNQSTIGTVKSIGGDKVPLLKDFLSNAEQGAKDLSSRGGTSIPSQVVRSIPGAATNLGLAFLSKGASVPTQLGRNATTQAVKQTLTSPTFINSFGQSYGGAYNQATAEGANRPQAITKSILQAFPQALIEQSGGLEKLPTTAAKGGFIRTIAKAGGEEALEELAQYPFEGLAKKATYAPNTPWLSTKENAVINPLEMGQNALVGGLAGGILGGGGKVINDISTKRTQPVLKPKSQTEMPVKQTDFYTDQYGTTANDIDATKKAPQAPLLLPEAKSIITKTPNQVKITTPMNGAVAKPFALQESQGFSANRITPANLAALNRHGLNPEVTKQSDALKSIEPIQQTPLSKLNKVQQAQQQAAPTMEQQNTFTIETDNGAQNFNTTDFKDSEGKTLDETISDDPVVKELDENLKDTASEPDEFIQRIAPSLKDRSGFMNNMNTTTANLERAFGKAFPYVKTKYLDSLDSSKGNFSREVTERTNNIYDNVVQKYGIQKGSKESAAIQWYGEGKRIQGSDGGFVDRMLHPQYNIVKDEAGREIKVPKMEKYSIEDLKREFPDKWQDIVESEKVFRKQYDEMVEEINGSRKQIYPYVEKQIEDLKQKGQDIDQDIVNYKNNLKNYEQQLKVIDDSILSKKAEMQGTKRTNTMKYTDLQRQIDNLEVRKTKFKQNKIDFTNRRISDLAKSRNEITKQLNSDDLLKNKRLLKRNDYFRHFKEMNSGVIGLFNIAGTPAQISSNLAGISEFTEPKSKWAGFMQQRGAGDYKADAVGGFIDYIKPAAYAVHIDPNITKIRQLAKDISTGTVKTKNANNLIKYLSDYANSLAGKSNKYDRVLKEDIPGGRMTFQAINWFTNRVKGNSVLMNVRSTISQVANVPAGVSEVKDPSALAKGMGQSMAQLIGKGDGAIKKSDFMSERYLDDVFDKFDTKLINQPKKFATWLLGFGDKVGTTFIWNSAYQKALANGDSNPIKSADDLTRHTVAGRGIGEVPLMQQSKLFQTVFPFQLEVGNLVHVVGKKVKDKDVAGLVVLMVGDYIFNGITEALFGDRVLPDPIDAMIDALSEEDTNALKVAGRLVGEGLSSIPMGQTAASVWPEYPTEVRSPVGGFTIPSRKQLFGDNDPTRYGGGILPVKALQDPFYKAIMPWGGSQLKKTVEGVQALNKGMVEKDGKMLYPVPKTLSNLIKAPLFGKYATDEAREYFDKNRSSLSVNQTEQTLNSDNPQAQYNNYMKQREINNIANQIKAINADPDMSRTEKNAKINKLQQKLYNIRAAQ